jgi:4-hydroxy-tetrahydrodipicolinate reductase
MKRIEAKIGITGCAGRMGAALARELQAERWPGLSLAGGTALPGTAAAVMDGKPVFAEPEKLFELSDLVIDFTEPAATARHLWLAAKHRRPFVCGTTGLSAAQEREMQDAAKETAIVYAANMSVGVNLLLGLVEQAAARLGPDWDIEIAETHHRHKTDAPSGTALALGRAAAQGRKVSLDAVKEGGERTGARPAGAIGFAVRRGGDVAGEHEVSFFGAQERVELIHRSADRAIFARGALRAAQWLLTQQPGPGLYSMRDVLGV